MNNSELGLKTDFVIIHIPATTALADELVDILDADLLAVGIKSLALHRGMFHLFTLHFEKMVSLSWAYFSRSCFSLLR